MYCLHTVTVYDGAIIKGRIYLYCDYYSAATKWGQYPRGRF